jgi:hypothetical protein
MRSYVRPKDRLGVLMNITDEEEAKIKAMSDYEVIKYIIAYLQDILKQLVQHDEGENRPGLGRKG